MAFEILDSGTVKMVAMIRFAADGVAGQVFGVGVKGGECEGGGAELEPLDMLPTAAVVDGKATVLFLASLSFGPDDSPSAVGVRVQWDAPEDGQNGEIDVSLLAADGTTTAGPANVTLLMIVPSQPFNAAPVSDL